ncbi:hypothetical protein O3P69_000662 [Scylla paramamosain]|uniref:Peptidase S1 domain-containing protein n=1 Tax=Scylla paramamosain TaxID=85552 RepID=A0AAW0UQJ7_SCYPA
MQVVAGDHTLYYDEGHEQTMVLSKIIQQEDYNSFNISNDVSVLKLSKPLTFNERNKHKRRKFIKKVCMMLLEDTLKRRLQNIRLQDLQDCSSKLQMQHPGQAHSRYNARQRDVHFVTGQRIER